MQQFYSLIDYILLSSLSNKLCYLYRNIYSNSSCNTKHYNCCFYTPPPTLLSSLVCNISQFSYLFGQHSINYSRLQSVQNIKEFFSHFAFKNVHFGKSNHVIRHFYYLPQCIIGYIEGTHTHTYSKLGISDTTCTSPLNYP